MPFAMNPVAFSELDIPLDIPCRAIVARSLRESPMGGIPISGIGQPHGERCSIWMVNNQNQAVQKSSGQYKQPEVTPWPMDKDATRARIGVSGGPAT
jgi:hypothetical protein